MDFVHRTGSYERQCTWFTAFAMAGLAAAMLSSAEAAPQVAPASVATPPAAGTVMDRPLQLITEAAQAYSNVRDYTCLFVKRERLRDQMQAENLIEMKARSQPFSVYLRWLGPASSAGQEVCYVAGRNGGQMRVHSTGLVGAFGFVSLRTDDPRVMQNSRHPVTEAGIGNLIERFSQRWELERRLNRTQVNVAEYSYAQRPCIRVETIHPDRAGGQFYSYRSVVYFDKQTHLPVRVETYDWPRSGGSPQGELVETYSYVNLRLNVGLTDAAFSY